MTRILAIALACLTLSFASASAATLGDALELAKTLQTAAKSCPKSIPGDIGSITVSLQCLTKTEATGGALAMATLPLAQQLMDECLRDVQANKRLEDCRAANNNFRKVPLPKELEAKYQAAKAGYEAFLQQNPRR